MSLPTRIYLTGFMGSGKSTLGPPLARIVGYSFVDLDERIEAALGCSIAECFERYGEELFRRVESEQLDAVSQAERTVVALGGGAVVRSANLELVKQTGLLVYLRWPADRLARRLLDSGTRPLLRDKDGTVLSEEELERRITGLLVEREPIYMQADVVVKLNRHRVTRAVDELITAIRRHVYGLEATRRRNERR